MFSNGSEAMAWQNGNCFKCWKYQSDTPPEKTRCKIALAIDYGYITGKLPIRVEKITKGKCPYRQDKRPVYKKQDKSMPLFEEAL